MTSCSLLILSTDKYRDLWSNCTLLYQRYWPDCPYPRYLASDTLPPAYPGFKSLGAGQKGLPWSDLLMNILEQIDSEYILLMLDDFYLTGRVDTPLVESLFTKLIQLNGGYLRIVPHKRWMVKIPGQTSIGEHRRGLPYRCSLQGAFWKKRILQGLLVPGETPWEFELYGGLRSDALKEPFLASYGRPIPYIDVLERGKWLPRGIRLCKREGLSVDLTIRPEVSLRDKMRRIWSNVIGLPIQMIPNSLRKKIRKYRHREYNLQNDFR